MQIERLMKRDSCTRETAEAKVSSQMPLDGKRKKASYVIENDGSREDTVVKASLSLLGRPALALQSKKGFGMTSPLACSSTWQYAESLEMT